MWVLSVKNVLTLPVESEDLPADLPLDYSSNADISFPVAGLTAMTCSAKLSAALVDAAGLDS